MLPWVERPVLEFDVAKPIAERVADVPAEARAAGLRLLEAVRTQIPSKARMLAHLVRLRTLNRFHAEILGAAAMVGADWRDVLLANVSYDLLVATFGCSTVALATPSGPVLARNMDWWPEELLAQASYQLRFHRAGTFEFASAGWPGATGVVTGLSARGFAVALNAVIGPERFSRLGYPVLLHLRRVLEDATDFDSARLALCQQRLMVSALFTLVGTDNRQRVVIERSPTRFAERWPEGMEPLIATNDYRKLHAPQTHVGTEIYETTCRRYDALCRFFSSHRGDRDADNNALLYALTDGSVIQSITAQHILLRPRECQMRVFVPRRLLSAE